MRPTTRTSLIRTRRGNKKSYFRLRPIVNPVLRLHKYATSKRHYDIFIINLLLSRLPSLYVYKYKEMLLDVEMTDLLAKYYTSEQSRILLHQIYDQYHKYVVVYPSYNSLTPISSALTENISKKQQLINMNYEIDLLNTVHISFGEVLSFEDSITERHCRERKSSLNSYLVSKAKVADRSHSREVKALTFQQRESSIDDIVDFTKVIEYYEDKSKPKEDEDVAKKEENYLSEERHFSSFKDLIAKSSERIWVNNCGSQRENPNENLKKVNIVRKDLLKRETYNESCQLKKNRSFASSEHFIDERKEKIRNQIDFKSKNKQIRDKVFKQCRFPDKSFDSINKPQKSPREKARKCIHQASSLPKLVPKAEQKAKGKEGYSLANKSKPMKCFYAKCIMMLYPSESRKEIGPNNNSLYNKRFVPSLDLINSLKDQSDAKKFSNVSIESNQNIVILDPRKSHRQVKDR